MMNTTEFEDYIKKQIQENDDIRDIRQSLSGLYRINISNAFCSSLFIPLIQHAINNTELVQLVDNYCTVIVEIYEYSITKDITNIKRVFNDCIMLIKDIVQTFEDDSIDNSKYGFNLEDMEWTTLLNLLAIAMQACSSMVSINVNDTGSDLSLNILWNYLPRILDCCTFESNTAVVTVLKAATNISNTFINARLVNIYNLDVEALLSNLLESLNIEDLPDETLDGLAESISITIQANPNVKISEPSEISSMTNSLATSLQQQEFNSTRIKVVLNLSCLLLKNYTKAPWLNDILDITNNEELEILKEKATLLLQYTEDIDIQNSQVEDMDIDQDTLRNEKQDPSSVIKCHLINKRLISKVEPIVETLISLNGGDEQCYKLLAKIKDISVYTDNTDISIICQPYIKSITEFITRILVIDPCIAENVTSLFGYEIPQFLSTFLRYVLPYAIIQTDDNDSLAGIATALQLNINDLCSSNAHHILLALLMEKNLDTRSYGYRRLQQILNMADAQKVLASNNATKITTILAMNLGKQELKNQSLKALEEMKNLIDMSSMSISQQLSQFFISILTKITRFISEKRINSLEIHDPHALDALKEIIGLLGSNIDDHALHLIKVFQSVNELPGMQREALSLWEKFISVLNDKAIYSHLNAVIKGLVDILPVSSPDVRVLVAHVIQNLLVNKLRLIAPQLSSLPVLPQFKEMEQVNKFVEEHLNSMRSGNKHSQETRLSIEMKQITDNLINRNDIQVLSKLQKLNIFLAENPNFPIRHSELYSQLLYLVRKYSSHKEISHLAVVCLGRIGAVDPGRVNVKIIEDSIFVMNNFKEQNENREFICALIIDHIIPAYNAVSNEQVHQYMQVSIQSLLECAGFRAMNHMTTRERSLTGAYKRWLRLPPPVKEFLMPFLQSSYQSSWVEKTIYYPILPQAENFADWIQKWYCKMASGIKVQDAQKIFAACIPIVISDVIDVTSFLLLYIVLHSILSGSGDDVRSIAEEMLMVLNTNADLNTDSDRGKMNHQCLQVVVSITEYCRKWMNNITPDDMRKKSEVSRVTQFLGLIPDNIMAIAAFNSKAYPQALMHFETYIKQQLNGRLEDPEILDYLRQIYTQMENPIDLVALLEAYSTILSHDEEIIRFETSGKWQEAEVLYKNKLAENPRELSAYTGYMDCLKKWGSYETILYISDKVVSKNPKWAPQINSFRIDSAWRVQDWNALEKIASLPIQKNPEALIGCILAKLRENQNLEAARLIEVARDNLIEMLSSNTADSYRKSYPIIFNLQMLQELEDAQITWESPNPIEVINKLETKWKTNYQSIISKYQYKHNLLELRRAAFFDIRPQSDTKIQASNLWLQIAKSSRKAGNLSAAFDAILKAEKIGNISCYNEKAKWYWAGGYKEDAINLLKSMGNTIEKIKPDDALLMTKFHKEDPTIIPLSLIRKYFARALKHTEKSEKAYHNCASFYCKQYPRDSVLDETKLKVLNYIVKTSAKALHYGSKYYYSSMSRLINAWFELAKLNKKPPQNASDNLILTIQKTLDDTNEHMNDILNTVAPYQFSLFLTRLISHLSIEDDKIASCLIKIISAVFASYPRSSIWLLLGAERSSSSIASNRISYILKKAQDLRSKIDIAKIINQAHHFVNALQKLAVCKVDDKTLVAGLDLRRDCAFSDLLASRNLDLYIPTETSLYPTLPEVVDGPNSDASLFPNDVPFISEIDHKVTVMKSLQRPKKITIKGSDGKEYGFLVKNEDDLRKDARMMEFNYMINSFLKKNSESRDSDLYIRTYGIIPLGDRWGLIQWINDLCPLKGIVSDIWVADGGRSVAQLSSIFNKEGQALNLEREIVKYFINRILPQCPAVFYKWFLKSFPEPNQWLSSRTRYTKTLAVMSIVGYMLGLGDRHAENILFDQKNGDCVHVDLNMLFDKGLILSVPEVVPFRLTHNLVDAMGILGYKGTFSNTCETTMNVLLENKDALLSVFQTLVNNYAVNENDVKKSLIAKPRPVPKSDEFMQVLEDRFKLDPGAKTNREVKRLIETASDKTNLGKMFAGWAPFV